MLRDLQIQPFTHLGALRLWPQTYRVSRPREQVEMAQASGSAGARASQGTGAVTAGQPADPPLSTEFRDLAEDAVLSVGDMASPPP